MLDKLVYNDKQKGYLMVEMMISITLIVVGLLGVFALLTQSYAMQQPLADQYTATYLASEGIEIVKNIIDTNAIQKKQWNAGCIIDGDYGVDFSSTVPDPLLAGVYLKFDDATGWYSHQVGRQTKFQRTVTIENVSNDELRIISTVAWKGKGGRAQKVVLEDHFFNWR
ncbi:MAG: prepilin-type N-terminal cleavage/methylation domain-containing protein [bacterium]